MINIQNFVVNSISESYTIDKIQIEYSPMGKEIGNSLVIKGVISVAFIDTNSITKERSNLNESDVYSYYYSIAVGTDAQKEASANTNTLDLFKDLNNGLEQKTIDFVLAKFNLSL
jgi:hypothetical protein